MSQQNHIDPETSVRSARENADMSLQQLEVALDHLTDKIADTQEKMQPYIHRMRQGKEKVQEVMQAVKQDVRIHPERYFWAAMGCVGMWLLKVRHDSRSRLDHSNLRSH
jgi:hypothetical protein